MDEKQRKRRSNVILELIKSEKDFVKNLKDVTEGYLQPARRHPEIFTSERINTIFSNIEQLYEFQRKFLASLETCINWFDPAASEVGRCFLEHQDGFSVYYYYCNNHPNATTELQELYGQQKFARFFEACRLLQNMIDISLDGFLLTPIQKICKYPLQLNELLKNTPENHPDYTYVKNAFECVKNCANLANERKRRIEALADIMLFQERFDNWFGLKLSETSSILIYSGEVSKMTSHNWSQGLQLHLFDHLLVYSKRDLIKRNTLILKGRICMDTINEISDADEKSKKGFKLFDYEQQKWFVFATKNEKEKNEWMNAFERERRLVEADEEEGFHITKNEIGVAKRSLNNRKYSRSARYRSRKPEVQVFDQLDIDEATTIMNRTLSLPSSIHPSHVMNFVQDFKVLSTGKAGTSPNGSNLNTQSTIEPVSANLHPATLSSGASSWFKKVGSKRISSKQPEDIETKIQKNSQETTYDELQRRHETIMICAERARLYRLNNNLPPLDAKQLSNLSIKSRQNQKQLNKVPNQLIIPKSNQHGPNFYGQAGLTQNFKNINLESEKQNFTQSTSDKMPQQQNVDQDEKTVVLPSGRIVRVRENAV